MAHKKNQYSILFLAVSAMLVLITRLRLLSIPLERDEGGFACIGRSLMQGESLYTTVFDNKPPVLYGIYMLFTQVFGYSAFGVHLGLLLFNLGAAWFLYKLVSDLLHREYAAYSAAFFLFFSVLPNVFGFAAHATQLLLLPGLAALWLLNRAKGYVPVLLSGMLLGLAFLIKQQAIGIMAGSGVLLFIQAFFIKKTDKKTFLWQLSALVSGALATIGICLLYFYATGRLQDLLTWTVHLPSQMAATVSAAESGYVLKYFHGFEVAMLVALAGIVLGIKDKEIRAQTLVFTLLFLFNLAVTALGVAFYPHYFVLALPFLAVLCSIGILSLSTFAGTRAPVLKILLAILILLIPAFLQSNYFIKADFREIHRQAYGLNPFPEMEAIGKVLKKRKKANDQILVLGSEPELYVAANAPLKTGHPVMLSENLPAVQGMHDDILVYLKNQKPAYVVYVPALSSWYPGYLQSNWVKEVQAFLQSNYSLIGAAEITKTSTHLLWDAEARKKPDDPTKLGAFIFQLKN